MASLTFVFADLSGFTALTEAHGDDDCASIAARFEEIAGVSLVGTARLVKTIGDAVMIVAEAPEDALDTATCLAEAVASEPLFPALRAGVHAGTAVARGDDYYGAAVNVAARVAGRARSGEILCTDSVASALTTGAVALEPLGPVELKNVSAPVHLYRVTRDSSSRTGVNIDPVCRMQVEPERAAATVVVDGRRLYFCSSRCAEIFVARRQGSHRG